LGEPLVHSSFKPVKNADFIIPVEIDNVVHQVYVLKRPHTDTFLERVGHLFECVLFTASLAKYADPVANLLDKRGVFKARLFREACVFFEGNYVKVGVFGECFNFGPFFQKFPKDPKNPLQDLDRLGRGIDRIVIVDNSPASYAFHPENAVPVGTWFDDPNDRELLELLPLMEELARCDNIYKVLNNQYDHRMLPPHPQQPQQQQMQLVPQMPPPNALPPVVPVTSTQSVPIGGVRRGFADGPIYSTGSNSTTIGVTESATTCKCMGQ